MTSQRQSGGEHKTREFLEGVRRRCPKHVPVLEALGDLYTKLGLYAEGLDIDLILTGKFPVNDTYWYNLACSYARMAEPARALESLRRAIELGYDDADWMTEDEDLTSLRALPEFADLVNKARAREAT